MSDSKNSVLGEVIRNSTSLSNIAERLGPDATEEDASACLHNLLAAGWGGQFTHEIPEDVFVAAALGPVPSPTSD